MAENIPKVTRPSWERDIDVISKERRADWKICKTLAPELDAYIAEVDPLLQSPLSPTMQEVRQVAKKISRSADLPHIKRPRRNLLDKGRTDHYLRRAARILTSDQMEALDGIDSFVCRDFETEPGAVARGYFLFMGLAQDTERLCGPPSLSFEQMLQTDLTVRPVQSTSELEKITIIAAQPAVVLGLGVNRALLRDKVAEIIAPDDRALFMYTQDKLVVVGIGLALTHCRETYEQLAEEAHALAPSHDNS